MLRAELAEPVVAEVWDQVLLDLAAVAVQGRLREPVRGVGDACGEFDFEPPAQELLDRLVVGVGRSGYSRLAAELLEAVNRVVAVPDGRA